MKYRCLNIINQYRDNQVVIGVCIFLLWLVHVSAIAGISAGYTDWFISKTPSNLMLSFLIMAIVFPFNQPKVKLLFVLFFVMGFIAEWVGVNTGILFGDYHYGKNLGIKLDGVPLLIGLNWSVLALATGAIADRMAISNFIKPFAAASMMLALDFLIEKSSTEFDFWSFSNDVVPIWNYVCWFLLSFLMQVVFRYVGPKSHFGISLHYFAVNTVFFGWFYGIHAL